MNVTQNDFSTVKILKKGEFADHFKAKMTDEEFE